MPERARFLAVSLALVMAMALAACAGGPPGASGPGASAEALDTELARARAGDADAAYRLGLDAERRAPPDWAAAKSWYQQAVRKNHVPAMRRLADLLEGQGAGASDPDFALLLRRAADQGGWERRTAPTIVVLQPPVVVSGWPNGTPIPVPAVPAGGAVLRDLVFYVDAVDLKSVTVNGRSVRPDAAGFVSVPIEALGNARTLVLEVRDARADRPTRTVLALDSPAPAAGARPAVDRGARDARAPVARRALLIANQRYQHWGALDTPVHDAQALARVLREQHGYQVSLLLNATQAQMRQALARLRNTADADDEVLIYYGGHGQLDAAGDRGYWVPVDGRARDTGTWVSNDEVADLLRALPARQALLVVDSCFSGIFNALVPREGGAPPADAAPANAPRPREVVRVRMAMSSGALEPVPDGIGEQLSVYAGALVDTLALVTLPVAGVDLDREVAARVRWRMAKLGLAQRPRYGVVPRAGHQAGDVRWVPQTAVR